MSTIADEVAALRGTKPATLKDLLTHPAFSRLLAAMSVSSLGDWIGFVAVTSLVTRVSGSTGSRRPRDRRRDDRQDAAGDPVRPDRGRARRPREPQADHDLGRHRARRDVRLDGLRARAVGDLPAVVRDRMSLPPVDAGPRRVAAEPRAAPAARERELDRAREHVRDPAAGSGDLRAARGVLQRARRARALPRGVAHDAAAAPRCRDVRLLGRDGERHRDPGPGRADARQVRSLAHVARHRRRAAVPA